MFSCGVNGACRGAECNYNTKRNTLPLEKRPLEFLEHDYELLSAEEKESVYRDLYGIEDPIDETMTPNFVNDKLKELDDQLNLLGGSFKRAYTMAAARMEEEQQLLLLEQTTTTTQQQSLHNDDETTTPGNNNISNNYYDDTPSLYVRSNKFRLMFLRAERFDSVKAAKRLARYLNEKLEIFGAEKLTKRIQQSDLSSKDLEVLYSGLFNINGGVDQSGRIIILHNFQKLGNAPPLSVRRMLLYLITMVMEGNEEAQKKGIVFIRYHMGGTTRSEYSRIRRSGGPGRKMFLRGFPLRFAAIHVCYDNVLEHVYLTFILSFLSAEQRRRMQCHFGNHQFCTFQLLTYGIDVENLSLLSKDGKVCTEVFHQFLQKERQMEEEVEVEAMA